MSRIDGVVTSYTQDINLVVPQVQTSAMALALYIQLQSAIDTSDSLQAQKASLDLTADQLKIVNQALTDIPPSDFNPGDAATAFQAFLDLLAAGLPGSSLAGGDKLMWYDDSTRYLGELVSQNFSSNADVLANAPEGKLVHATINGADAGYFYRAPGSSFANRLSPTAFATDKAPDGSNWISMTGTTIPDEALPGSFLKSTDSSNKTTHYLLAVNKSLVALDPSDPGKPFLAFPGSLTATQVQGFRDALSDVQDKLMQNSRVQSAYMLQLTANLQIMINAVSNSLYRLKRSEKTIIDRGVGD